MKKQTFRRFRRAGCLALALLFVMSVPNAAMADASGTQKDETVYVSLDAAGNTTKTTVSDWLHSDGSTRQIADQSDLKNIKNVKSDEKAVKTGNTLTWMLDTDNSDSNIYYEGTTDKKTPLKISVSYTLNGSPVSAAQIAGKSGKVTIKISVQNTDVHNVAVDEKDTAMYTPMTAVVAVTLPSDTFQNVSVSKDGKVFSDGNNQFVTFLAMPGLTESLNLKNCGISQLSSLDFPENLTITADAKEFELDPIAVAATPELLNEDDLKKADDIDEMKTNLNKLKGMQDDIQKADPDKDIRSLFTNPDRTAAARLLVDDVFDFYGLDTKAVDFLPEYVTDKNIKLYDRVTSDLDRADLNYILDDKTLRGLNDRVTDENVEKVRKLLSDYDEIKTFDMTKLNRVLKVMDSYDKNYGKLDDLFDDVKKIYNRFDKSDVHTLSVLDSSSVQNRLNSVLDDMTSLSSYSGVYHSLNLDEDDYDYMIASLIEKRLKKGNVSALKMIDELLPKADSKGYITAASLGKTDSLSTSQKELVAAAVENDTIHTVIPLSVLNDSLTTDFGQITSEVSDQLSGKVPDPVKTALVNALQRDLTADAETMVRGMASYIDSDHNISVKNLIAAVGRINGQVGQAKQAFKSGNPATVATVEQGYFKNFTDTVNGLTAQYPAMKGSLASLQSAVMGNILDAVDKNTENFDPTVVLKEQPSLASSILIKKTSLEYYLKNNLKADDLTDIVKSQMHKAFLTVSDLMNDTDSLKSALSSKKALGSDYLSDISGLRSSLRSQKNNLKDLEDDAEDISDDDEGRMEEDFDRARDLLEDKDEMDYLISWTHKLKDMKSDMDGNDANVALMRDLLKEYDDPKIKNFRSMVPTLQTDLDDSRPILQSIKDRLDLPDINASMHKLPQTTATLLKTEKDVRANRNIINIFKKTTQPDTVALFKKTFSTLDDFQQKGSIDDYIKKVNDAESLLDRKDEYVKLSDQYSIFTQAADGATTKLKFVYKTAEIKKPETKKTTQNVAVSSTQQKQSSGFFERLKSAWNETVNSLRKTFRISA
ncbi:MAG: hypothetical protein LKJ45_00545 [Oscillospiraceae bacterium]|jgi:hypothetical protein|nr:hypothetical protein [Oscillospiraceae bacterium]